MSANQGLKSYGWDSADPLADHAYTFPSIVKLLPLGKGLCILGAGCGNGFIAGELASMGHCVTGIDLSEDGINLAHEIYPNVSFEICSVYDDLHSIVENVDVVVSS